MSLSYDEVQIDGNTYAVTNVEVHHTLHGPPEISLEIIGSPPLTTAVPPFPFMGDLWYLTSLSYSASHGHMTQTLSAISTTMTTTPKATPKSRTGKALPPKSRPSVTVAVDDLHANCVPLEHYVELMAFVARTLVDTHDGYQLITDADLSSFHDWKVLHSEDASGVHSFVAVHPDVAIGEVVDEEDIPF